MPNFVPVVRKTVVAFFGIGVAATTAMAQSAPKAQCPGGVEGEAEPTECPPTEPPVAEEPPPAPPAEPQAQAQPEPEPLPPPQVTQPVAVEEPSYLPTGIAVSLGGGVSGFTNSTLRDTTGDGGAWGVRAALGLRSYLGLEVEYTGSAQSIDALGISSDSVLVGNGVQGVVRVNVLPMYSVQPFLFGGLGWRHYNLTNEGINTSDIFNSDDVMEIPMGGGIAWTYRGFLADARGEFRYATFEDMIPDPRVGQTGGLSMHRYSVTANIGYEF